MTLSAYASRPLFVPPGIAVVRTGPTTRAEFERLLEQEPGCELSGIRPTPAPARRTSLLQIVAAALQLTRARHRSPRSFESR